MLRNRFCQERELRIPWTLNCTQHCKPGPPPGLGGCHAALDTLTSPEGPLGDMKSSIYRGVTLFRPTNKWRAQISAGGKTLSLGDHDTEQEAARAFDRAVIHKLGREARTNFPILEYEDEIEQLQAMAHQDLVAMLRRRARKSGTQTSNYRGVSLLRQTGRWHAQINAGGRQVHLGFFGTEREAARAYDRAAITKGAGEGSRIVTNFELSDYAEELAVLQSISQEELVGALAEEGTRKQAMELLVSGFTAEAASGLFGRPLGLAPPEAVLEELMPKAERAMPKPSSGALPATLQAGKQEQQQEQQQEQLKVEEIGTLKEEAGAVSAEAGVEEQRTPSKPPARPPLPPQTPQAPAPLQGPALGSPLSAAAMATAGTPSAAAASSFPASPPTKLERSARRSASGSHAGAGGVKRSLSYPELQPGAEAGGVGDEAGSGGARPQQQRQQQPTGRPRKRRKVAQPSRAAHI